MEFPYEHRQTGPHWHSSEQNFHVQTPMQQKEKETYISILVVLAIIGGCLARVVVIRMLLLM